MAKSVPLQTIAHQLQLHPTGLMADFLKLNPHNGMYEPVSGRMLERPSDQYYSWNSCRSPWRLAVYYACAPCKSLKPQSFRAEAPVASP